MLNNSLNFESLRILHHMVFTLTMKHEEHVEVKKSLLWKFS